MYMAYIHACYTLHACLFAHLPCYLIKLKLVFLGACMYVWQGNEYFRKPLPAVSFALNSILNYIFA